jgi:hypothetical protein
MSEEIDYLIHNRKESDIVGFDGLRAGVLYSVSDGGIHEYVDNVCNFSGHPCNINCILMNKELKTCEYKNSLLHSLIEPMEKENNKIEFNKKKIDIIHEQVDSI